jgi:hypothetical protein
MKITKCPTIHSWGYIPWNHSVDLEHLSYLDEEVGINIFGGYLNDLRKEKTRFFGKKKKGKR